VGKIAEDLGLAQPPIRSIVITNNLSKEARDMREDKITLLD